MIPTGCFSIDKLLGGGITKGCITQIYGHSGSGKTNIALFLAFTASKMNKKIIFLDTEGSFHQERVNQIFGKEKNKLLKNIKLVDVTDFKEQQNAIEDIIEKNTELIIVDSMTSLYRAERNDDNYYDLNRTLGKQALKLLSYAREKQIPILITNQVYTNIDTKTIEPVGGDILKYYSKVILEVEKNGDSRKIKLKKHICKKDGDETEFNIVEKGLN